MAINKQEMKEDKNIIKAAIAYLVRSTKKDIASLKRSLSLLDANFNDQFNYPVIIFHEDFNENLMEDIRKATRSDLKFEKVKFEIPDFLNREEIPEFVYVGELEFPIGFRHMCRFFSGLIFQHPALRDYDYLWRLDADSFLRGKIDYDVFRFMHKHNYMYGYIAILKEHPEVAEGLWDITKKYIEDNNIQPIFLHKFTPDGVWDRSYYYANFEISKLDFWRSDEFLKFFDYIDRSGGIYKYRWGDTIIHFLAISIFVPENQVHKFSDIAYQHQNYVNNYSINIFDKLKMMLSRYILRYILKLSSALKRKSNLYKKFIKLLNI